MKQVTLQKLSDGPSELAMVLRHIAERHARLVIAEIASHPVPTSHLEKMQMRGRRKRKVRQ